MPENNLRYTVYRDSQGQYRWRAQARNNETVASGEAYENRADAEHAVELQGGTLLDAPTADDLPYELAHDHVGDVEDEDAKGLDCA